MFSFNVILDFEERNTNFFLSACLDKIVQHVYCLATFLPTVEIGFDICEEYLGH